MAKDNLRDVMLQVPVCELAKVSGDDLLDVCHQNVLHLVEQGTSRCVPFFNDRLDILVGHHEWVMVGELSRNSAVIIRDMVYWYSSMKGR